MLRCSKIWGARGPAGVPRGTTLLSDAKTAEYLSQQIIRRIRPGDLTQRLLRQSEIFGEQFEPLAIHVQVGPAQMGLSFLQRLDMPCAGHEESLPGRAPTRRVQQRLLEQLHPGSGLG